MTMTCSLTYRRRYEWEVEKGDYTFALLENGGMDVDTGRNVTLKCV